jgi:hypothetical protein
MVLKTDWNKAPIINHGVFSPDRNESNFKETTNFC